LVKLRNGVLSEEYCVWRAFPATFVNSRQAAPAILSPVLSGRGFGAIADSG
jgi:hypothetical protein